MKRILVLSILGLAVLGGVASADHKRHRAWKHRHGVQAWSGGVVVRPVVRAPRVHIHAVRQPIVVQQPVVSVRYTRYDRRPRMIAENYDAMPGYHWVAGSWSWNGAEWIWQQGRYEADVQPYAYPSPAYESNYQQPGYSSGYPGSSGYSTYSGSSGFSGYSGYPGYSADPDCDSDSNYRIDDGY